MKINPCRTRPGKQTNKQIKLEIEEYKPVPLPNKIKNGVFAVVTDLYMNPIPYPAPVFHGVFIWRVLDQIFCHINPKYKQQLKLEFKQAIRNLA